MVKSHKNFGAEAFKVRLAQYFDHCRQNRYKTPHLLMREMHRLAPHKTKAEKLQEKEKLAFSRQPNKTETPTIPTTNMIDCYPDDVQPITSAQMIETVTAMIHEDESNEVGHRNKFQRIKRMLTKKNSSMDSDGEDLDVDEHEDMRIFFNRAMSLTDVKSETHERIKDYVCKQVSQIEQGAQNFGEYAFSI